MQDKHTALVSLVCTVEVNGEMQTPFYFPPQGAYILNLVSTKLDIESIFVAVRYKVICIACERTSESSHIIKSDLAHILYQRSFVCMFMNVHWVKCDRQAFYVVAFSKHCSALSETCIDRQCCERLIFS